MRILRSIYRLLKSWQLAIILMAVIAIFAAVGTLVPQNHLIETNKFYIFLNNIYYSKVFLVLLLLFILNLILCSVDMFGRLKIKNNSNSSKWFEVQQYRIVIFKKLNLRIFLIEIIHFGVLTIASGFIISSIWGFRGVVMVPQGSSTNVVYTSNKTIILPFYIHNSEFILKYYSKFYSPSDYQTKGYIFYGEKKIPFNIKVNHPFRYKSIWFYQQSYMPDIKKSYMIIRFQMRGMQKDFNVPYGSTLDAGGLNIRLNKVERDKGIPIANITLSSNGFEQSGWIKEGESINFGDFIMKVPKIHISYTTVLSAAKDPGSVLILFGFIIIAFFIFLILLYKLKMST